MRSQRGFTLVELVLVIVIGSVIAATIAVFFRPAVEAWLAVRVRAELTDQAATALQTMQRDVRLAVPNSVRSPGDACFELVPTSAGGRFRRAPDTLNDGGPPACAGAGCSKPLDLSTTTTEFDVLSPLASTPAVGDWVVVDNQNGNDVYQAGVNRSQISALSTPAASLARLRVAVAPIQFPTGYGGGRFVVVPNNQQAVFYVCSGAGVNAGGDGTGTLVRLQRYGFNAAYPGACPATAGGAVLATHVSSCSFVYDPNLGATQQSGFVSMRLALQRNHETVSLVMGAHVVNVP